MFPVATWSTGPSADAVHACIVASEEGQRLRDERALVSARDQFVRCGQPDCPPPIQKDCAEWLTDLERRLPSIVPAARDPAGTDLHRVRVVLDDKLVTETLDGKALPLDPGPHRFVFEAPQMTTAVRTIVVREGEQHRVVDVVLQPDERAAPAGERRPIPLASVVLGGIGLVALGGFAYFGLTGQADKDRLEGSCAASRTCARDDVDAARTKLLVADVALGVGLVSLGAAAVVFFATNARGP